MSLSLSTVVMVSCRLIRLCGGSVHTKQYDDGGHTTHTATRHMSSLPKKLGSNKVECQGQEAQDYAGNQYVKLHSPNTVQL